ncbi:hypothetical protein UG55_10846 [Frankia sp. EI5c]|nr:hypothetical protein UG55_10846 [Frankia sp. EI5c]
MCSTGGTMESTRFPRGRIPALARPTTTRFSPVCSGPRAPEFAIPG